MRAIEGSQSARLLVAASVGKRALRSPPPYFNKQAHVVGSIAKIERGTGIQLALLASLQQHDLRNGVCGFVSLRSQSIHGFLKWKI